MPRNRKRRESLFKRKNIEVCPHCGKRIDDEEVDVLISGNTVQVGGVLVELSPTEFGIFDILFKAGPGWVHNERLGVASFHGQPSSDNWASVYIFKLRNKFEGTKIEIESKWGGYYRVMIK